MSSNACDAKSFKKTVPREKMTIDIKKIEEIKMVTKPWGYEKWIADGHPNFKYALKEIFFKTGYKTSIQFHEFKEETNYVQRGDGVLYFSTTDIDIKKFKNNEYSEEEIQNIINSFEKIKLIPGVVVHIKPSTVHRVEATTDLTIIESSTVELNDVYRLNDEWDRGHGKIEHEHHS
jgi:mannose-6-phosphate isomerase